MGGAVILGTCGLGWPWSGSAVGWVCPGAILAEFCARVASVAGGDTHLQPEAGEGDCAAGGATQSAIREQWMRMAMVR